MSSRSVYREAVSFDPGRSEEVDAQSHRPFPAVTRVVTRPSLMLAVIYFNALDVGADPEKGGRWSGELSIATRTEDEDQDINHRSV